MTSEKKRSEIAHAKVRERNVPTSPAPASIRTDDISRNSKKLSERTHQPTKGGGTTFQKMQQRSRKAALLGVGFDMTARCQVTPEEDIYLVNG